ncbi:family 2 glycosyl transferase [Thermincola ferriacetica]|uniref:Family 2 glycosyl transferase n=1 Tax=Thermincola ferriacetica TaxID=281456 RepID=A0A0L6W5L1_9FIRM|nr:hypothetical protein [Thermincola ferriacetica]KNZ70379.1 family 2 glycosyl transferase [Thermincola ferriacetica]
MIVRNEEKNLARCLLSCIDLIDEIIIPKVAEYKRRIKPAKKRREFRQKKRGGELAEEELW